MYVIIDQRSDETSILLGPSEWRPSFFSFRLSEDLETEIKITEEDKERVPFSVIEGITIKQCDVVYEEINGVFQRHEGPVITFDDNTGKVVATYVSVNKSLEELKKHFKDKISSERWNKENEFINVNIGDETYMIQASRSTRDALTQKYIAMEEDSTVNWKFRLRWANLTKSDVLYILKIIDAHVQSQFDKEVEIINSLEEAMDHETFKNIVLQRELV